MAGESIFLLPFVLPRIFRVNYLETFQLTNLQLGICFSIYGVVALFSYLLGGSLADRFSPKKLIAGSLLMTAMGGFYMSSIPSFFGLKVLFFFWGFSTIFFFWSALIKSTRLEGEQNSQEIAYGILEGGRGLVAALIGTFGVIIFGVFQEAPLTVVIQTTSLIIIIFAFLFYFLYKEKTIDKLDRVEGQKENLKERIGQKFGSSSKAFSQILKDPITYLMMLIVMVSYMAYKLTDVLPQYAKEVLNFNDVQSGTVGTLLLYGRSFVGFLIGIFGSRIVSIKGSLWSFVFLLIGALLLGFGMYADENIMWFVVGLIPVALGTYAMRVFYFSVMKSVKVPLGSMGATVGLVSVIGYSPDIFMGPLIGFFLDNRPAIIGHRDLFSLLIGLSVTGVILIWILKRLQKS